VIVGIRPEQVSLVGPGEGGLILRGRISVVEHLGAEVVCHLDIGAARVDTSAPEDKDDDMGGVANAFVARVRTNAPVQFGEQVAVRLEPADLRFFDPATTKALA
jgi:ABC-type sugar transport system ATPase subunit